MPKLIMYMGLPGSGKSTQAREAVRANPNGIKRVNKDDLRAMLDDGHWSKGNEKFVLQVRDQIVRAALGEGKHVIVDDTNLHPKHEQQLRQIAKECSAGFGINDTFLDVPVEECIKRDLKRANSVGSEVILSMYNNFLKPAPVVYTPPEGKPPAVIVDIDGTLAHNVTGRGWYDWHRVGEDALDAEVAALVKALFRDYTIILLSGREDVCRAETEQWLNDGEIPRDLLFMRAAGDNRQDAVIKKEIFDALIRDMYDVKFVLDDRNQVVRMWRDEIGLKVFQVADGDF